MPSISYKASEQASTRSSRVHLLYLFLRHLSMVLYLNSAFLFTGMAFNFLLVNNRAMRDNKESHYKAQKNRKVLDSPTLSLLSTFYFKTSRLHYKIVEAVRSIPSITKSIAATCKATATPIRIILLKSVHLLSLFFCKITSF